MWLTLIPTAELENIYIRARRYLYLSIYSNACRSRQLSAYSYGGCEFLNDLYYMINKANDHYSTE